MLTTISMDEFDPEAPVHIARRALERTTDPRARQIIGNFIDHVLLETSGDLPALMRILSPKVQSYVAHGTDAALPQSYAEAERYYAGLFTVGAHVFHYAIDHFAVGDDVIFTDGVFHQLLDGRLAEMTFGEELDSEKVYLVSNRIAMAFLFDENGLSAGEHAYPTGLRRFTEVSEDELPASYLSVRQRLANEPPSDWSFAGSSQ